MRRKKRTMKQQVLAIGLSGAVVVGSLCPMNMAEPLGLMTTVYADDNGDSGSESAVSEDDLPVGLEEEVEKVGTSEAKPISEYADQAIRIELPDSDSAKYYNNSTDNLTTVVRYDVDYNSYYWDDTYYNDICYNTKEVTETGILYSIVLEGCTATWVSVEGDRDTDGDGNWDTGSVHNGIYVYKDLESVPVQNHGNSTGGFWIHNVSMAEKTFYLWIAEPSEGSIIGFNPPKKIPYTENTESEALLKTSSLPLGKTELGDGTPYYSYSRVIVCINDQIMEIRQNEYTSYLNSYKITVPAGKVYKILPGEKTSNYNSGFFLSGESLGNYYYGWINDETGKHCAILVITEDGERKCCKYTEGQIYYWQTGEDFVLENTTSEEKTYYVEPQNGLKSMYLIDTPVTEITFTQSSFELALNETITLDPTVLPENASNKDVIWQSSDETVVAVNEKGEITGKSVGMAIITCTATDGSGVIASCEVKVGGIKWLSEYKSTAISLNAEQSYHNSEEDMVYAIRYGIDRMDNQSIHWTDPNSYYYDAKTIQERGILYSLEMPAHTKASVLQGPDVKMYIYSDLSGIPIWEGKNIWSSGQYAGITFQNVSSSQKTFYVWIAEPDTAFDTRWGDFEVMPDTNATRDDVILNAPILELGETEFEEETPYCGYTPVNVLIDDTITEIKQYEAISYTNAYKVVVPSGEAYKIIPGKKARENGGSWINGDDSIRYFGTIKEWNEDLNQLVDIAYLSIDANGKRRCVTRSFNATTGKFDLSDFVLENNAGEDRVYYIEPDELSSMYLTNSSDSVFVEEIQLNKKNIELGIGMNFELSATISPSYAIDQNVTWKSTDDTIASVDDNGLVTGNGVGTATITCAASDGSGVYASCEVIVDSIKAISENAERAVAIVNKDQSYKNDHVITTTRREINYTASHDEEIDGRYYYYHEVGEVTDQGILYSISLPAHTGKHIGITGGYGTVYIYKDLDTVPVQIIYNGSVDGSDFWLENVDSVDRIYYIWIQNSSGDVSAMYDETISLPLTEDTWNEAILKAPDMRLGDNSIESDEGISYYAYGSEYILLDNQITEVKQYECIDYTYAYKITVPAGETYQVLPGEKAFEGAGWWPGYNDLDYRCLGYVKKWNDNWGDFETLALLYIGSDGTKRCIKAEYNAEKGEYDFNDVVLENTTSKAQEYYVTEIQDLKSIQLKDLTSINVDIPTITDTMPEEVEVGSTVTEDELISNIDNSLSTAQQTILNHAVNEGQTLTYRLDVEDSGNTAEQQAVKAYGEKNNFGISEYFDISVGIYGDNTSTPLVKISETAEEIPLTIAIPAELKKDGREFYVLRFHEGEVTVLPATRNADGTLSFSSKLFSTYALAYRDLETIVTTVAVTTIRLNETSASVNTGSKLSLTATITPSNASNKSVTWTSSNTNVATVDSNGTVITKSAGTTTITCTAADGSGVKAVCTVMVTEDTSTDYTSTEAFVTRLYQKCLEREPEDTGLEYWNSVLANKERTGAQVVYGFVFSKEYQKKSTTNEEFVEMLYNVLLDRASDAGGKAHWLELLGNGVSREYVFRGFVMSQEFTNICNSYNIERGSVTLTQARDKNPRLTAYVNRMYIKALGRNGEEDGLNHWCNTVQTGVKTPEQVAESFILSQEFKNKNLSDEEYVKALYRTILGREYDQSGLNHWLGELKRGCTREEILHRFATSKEFKNIQTSLGF